MRSYFLPLSVLAPIAFALALAAQACGSSHPDLGFQSGNDGGNDGTVGDGGASTDSPVFQFDGQADSQACKTCSTDFHAVIDCQGNVLQQCSGQEGCDPKTLTCANACTNAVNSKQSVGCEYYATYMDQFLAESSSCFAAIVANTWNTPAHLTVERGGTALPVASFTRTPSGFGPSLIYKPYDNTAGIAPGDVAILFLVGVQGGGGGATCPVAGAIPGGVMMQGQTGVGQSFHITTDVPVVSYEINPYGGGSAAVTGASLLLPTSAWDTNYIAVNAWAFDIANPSMNIVAMADNTTVKMVPVAPVTGGGTLPSGSANVQMSFTLSKGQHAQFSQQSELTGSVIQSDKPIGLMAGQACLRAPYGVYYCDHGEQMIPPIRALGNEYVGVMYRPRFNEPAVWRVVGTVNGTNLTWSTNVGGPTTLSLGQSATFQTGTPFVVKSQDAAHPFMLFSYMSGSEWSGSPGNDGGPFGEPGGGKGDADFVISVPPQQYMPSYVFFTDPTYPETNLVVVRAKSNGNFEDVKLDCAGVLTGWKTVGEYEWTRADLITGNFQGVGGCSTGRHEIVSKGPFGLWVWGWGTGLTTNFTANVSYGYPAGMNVQPINQVVIPPTPK